MTERQQATYDLIKQNSLRGKITTQREVIDNYPIELFKDGYAMTTCKKSHDICSAVWSDIEEINFDSKTEIIISDKFTYRIAKTVNEANIYCDKYLKDALKKLKRHWNIKRKINRNNQGMFLDSEDAVNFYSAFIKEVMKDETAENQNATGE